MVLVLSNGTQELRDGQSIKLNLDGKGKKMIKISVDNEELDIPLVEPSKTDAQKMGMSEALLKSLREQLEKKNKEVIEKQKQEQMLRPKLPKSQGSSFNFEDLPENNSINDPKWEVIKPQFSPESVKSQVERHLVDIYKVFKANEETENIENVLEDTKFMEAWMHNFIDEQRHLLDINHVHSQDKRFKILNQIQNTFTNMYRTIRSNYQANKPNFLKYKKFLKAIKTISEQLDDVE